MKGKIFWGTILLLLINISRLFAQGCGPPDPDTGATGDCPVPLDNWVLILAGAFLMYAMFKLYQEDKFKRAI